MSNGNGNLPRGWNTAHVGDVVRLTNGFAFKPSHWKDNGLPIVRIQNLNNPDAPFNRCPDKLPEKIIIDDGDLLFAWSGTPGTSFGAHIWNRGKAYLNQHIFKVNFDESSIDKRFLQLAINQNLNEYISAAHGGAGLAHITKGKFESSVLLLPPLSEQRRIVEKIDELFSDIDKGEALLDRVRRNLDRYRASLLKAAVTGSLTAEWRKKNHDIEPASELLSRILAERGRRWEQEQLAKFQQAKKQPPKGWKERYEEPASPEIPESMVLPDGWCWASIDQVSSRIQYGSSAKASSDESGIPVLRMGNIGVMGDLDVTSLKYLPKSHDEFPSLLLNPGDVLFNRTNSAELVGKTAVYEGTPSPCSFASYLIRVKLIAGIEPRFISSCLNSGFGRAWIKRVVNQTVGQANVNGTKLAAFSFPLPPSEEQREIVGEIERLDSICVALTEAIDGQQKKTSALRQSILKRTFEGKLVSQQSLNGITNRKSDRASIDRFEKTLFEAVNMEE